MAVRLQIVVLLMCVGVSAFANKSFRQFEVAFAQFELGQNTTGPSVEVLQAAHEEVERARGVRDTQFLERVCESNALKILEAGRVQDAIWLLFDCNMLEEGQYLSSLLERYLNEHELSRGKKIGQGKNGAIWATIGKIKVVAKQPSATDQRFWFLSKLYQRYGVAASRLAESLGLSTVPHFQTKLVGDEIWTVQVAIENSEVSGIDFKGDFENYTKYLPELFVIDYLSQNFDRHGGNSLRTADDRIIGIDNEMWFLTPFFVSSSARVKEYTVNKALYERILQLRKSDIDQIFKGTLSMYERQIVWLRMKKLKSIVRVSSSDESPARACSAIF